MENTVEIWCDGSFRRKEMTAGAGWVIRHPDGRKEQGHFTLPRLRNSFAYGSQIAELSAVTHAMNAIPPHSHAVIHMDCRHALESLQTGALTFKTRMPAPALQTTFRRAAQSLAKLGSVTFELTRDNADHRMAQAHRLSRLASTPTSTI